MASDFLEKNFKSLRGTVSKNETDFIKQNLPKEEDEDEIIKGVVSDAEMKFIKSLLPK